MNHSDEFFEARLRGNPKPPGTLNPQLFGIMIMNNGTTPHDKIETVEQRETFRRMLLGMLDDPQIQQKIAAFLRRSGIVRSTTIGVPQRWFR